jgi:uncharacterized protein YukE
MTKQPSTIRGFRRKLGHFIGSYKGKTIFNFCYGFGASLAILGTLFKLLHLGGANIALAIGLGTEVFIFALSAFEPPFRNYRWEEVFPVLKTHSEEDRPAFGPGGTPGGPVIINGQPTEGITAKPGSEQAASFTGTVQTGVFTGPPTTPPPGTILGNASPGYGAAGITSMGPFSQATLSEEETKTLSESIKRMSEAVAHLNNLADIIQVSEKYLQQLSDMTENLNRFSAATASLAEVSDILLQSYRNITENSDTVSENSRGYVEQMAVLNKNLTGLNTIYEIQLKSISSQIDTIDRVNKGLLQLRDMYEGSLEGSERFKEGTDQMAENLSKLNKVYTRMLEAMVPDFGFGGFAPRPASQPTAPHPTASTDQKEQEGQV